MVRFPETVGIWIQVLGRGGPSGWADRLCFAPGATRATERQGWDGAFLMHIAHLAPSGTQRMGTSSESTRRTSD